MKVYSYKDLIHYYKESKTYSEEEYYINYYKALSIAFGIDLTKELERKLDYLQRIYWKMFQESIRKSEISISPFSGILEASQEFVEYFDSDIITFGKKKKKIHKAHLDMQIKIIETIFGKLEKKVTSKDLLLHGFDDSQEPPDLWEYY